MYELLLLVPSFAQVAPLVSGLGFWFLEASVAMWVVDVYINMGHGMPPCSIFCLGLVIHVNEWKGLKIVYYCYMCCGLIWLCSCMC